MVNYFLSLVCDTVEETVQQLRLLQCLLMKCMHAVGRVCIMFKKEAFCVFLGGFVANMRCGKRQTVTVCQ